MPRGAPSMSFSSESVKSAISTVSWSRRAASSAASLARFARSAPTMPGVVAAIASRSTLGASGIERVCTSRIAPAGAVGGLHGDAPVEAPGAQQRRVEHVGPVRRGEHDDGLVALEAVQLGEDLVERLLALVVGAGHRDRSLARAADRVELVDEDDRGRGLLGLREQVAHARGADADDRLDELRRRDREERGVRLARDRAREQRLAGPRRAREEHAVRHPPAEAPVALGSRRKSTISDSSALASSMPATSAKVTGIVCGSTRRARERPKAPSAPIPPPATRTSGDSTNRPTIRIVGPKPSRISTRTDCPLVDSR